MTDDQVSEDLAAIRRITSSMSSSRNQWEAAIKGLTHTLISHDMSSRARGWIEATLEETLKRKILMEARWISAKE